MAAYPPPSGNSSRAVPNDPYTLQYIRRWIPKTRAVLWLLNQTSVPKRNRTGGADYVVTVSSYLAHAISEECSIAFDSITTNSTIRSGVNSLNFTPLASPRSPTVPITILCIGRLDPTKSIDTALDAVRLLKSGGANLHLTVVGWAPGSTTRQWLNQR